MAGQKESYTYDQPINTVISQDLILSILKKEVNSPKEILEWLDRNQDSK
jgi:hypothetical protein